MKTHCLTFLAVIIATGITLPGATTPPTVPKSIAPEASAATVGMVFGPPSRPLGKPARSSGVRPARRAAPSAPPRRIPPGPLVHDSAHVTVQAVAKENDHDEHVRVHFVERHKRRVTSPEVSALPRATFEAP